MSFLFLVLFRDSRTAVGGARSGGRCARARAEEDALLVADAVFRVSKVHLGRGQLWLRVSQCVCARVVVLRVEFLNALVVRLPRAQNVTTSVTSVALPWCRLIARWRCEKRTVAAPMCFFFSLSSLPMMAASQLLSVFSFRFFFWSFVGLRVCRLPDARLASSREQRGEQFAERRANRAATGLGASFFAFFWTQFKRARVSCRPRTLRTQAEAGTGPSFVDDDGNDVHGSSTASAATAATIAGL